MPPTPFTPAWLADAPQACSLLPRHYADPVERAAAVRRAAERRCEPAVLDSLRATTPAQERSLQALSRPGTTVVCTGQQAGLFGGPLYTVYKAAASIVNARALEDETDIRCVPVFWLQNEDHDFEEIAGTTVLGPDGRLHHLKVEAEGDADASITQRTLGPSVTQALQELETLLGNLSEAQEALDLLRRCWQPGRSPDAAFRDWVDAVFGPFGLLVIDPADPALAAAALPVHRRAIDEAEEIGLALQERCTALEQAGFAPQVHVRPRSPLSFFHPDGPGGPRYRIEPVLGGYELCGTSRRLETDPGSCFYSTSALLRPILQDVWLPTAAYVGGPSEIAYFAQLPPLYDHFGISMPLVVPRARFRVLDASAVRLLDQLQLEPDQLAAPREQLLAQIARPGSRRDPDALTTELLAPLAVLGGFRAEAESLDAGLAAAVDKTAGTVEHAVGRLVDRYRQALARDDAMLVDRLDRVLARLLPRGAPQERVQGWPWYAARYGERFVAQVIDATQPFDGTLRELRP